MNTSPNRHAGHVVELGVVVLGVTDRDRARAFWEQALGYHVRTDGFGGWAVVLEPPAGRAGGRIALQMSDTPPSPRPRVHLDLHVANRAQQADEASRLVELGATAVDWEYPYDADFIVLADTEGNVFCIVNLGHPH